MIACPVDAIQVDRATGAKIVLDATCVGCKANADCSAMTFGKVCNTTTTSCVECVANADCTTATFGPATHCRVARG